MKKCILIKEEDQSKRKEQARFTYFQLGKVFEK